MANAQGIICKMQETRMAGLSKSRILAHRQCPKRLWLQTYRPELAEPDPNAAARFAQGAQVGEVARQLFPDGVLIAGDDLRQALRDTAEVLARSPQCPVFEATFEHDGVLVRVDLLLPDGEAYRLVEVKSSTAVKDYHRSDAAVQSWVTENAGVPISRTEIAYIDTSFAYAGYGDYHGLLAYADISPEVSALSPEIPAWTAAARATLSGEEPRIAPGAQCHEPFECPFFAHCAPREEGPAGYPPEDLSRARALATELRSEGYTDLRQVPEERLSRPLHRRIRQAALTGSAELDPAAGKLLSAQAYPRRYLDFETIYFAVPIWADTRPYATQIPFQWSCHVEAAAGAVMHRAYLADGPDDPRRRFAETLLDALGETGPIFVYNAAFECRIMRELAEYFPDLAPRLLSGIGRVVDLLPIARPHYYHPEMHGSWSIKAVLPTIAPELAYEDLEVADGGMAQEAFREMLHPDTSAERSAALRRALLEYCERDTVALVHLVRYFEEGNSVVAIPKCAIPRWEGR